MPKEKAQPQDAAQLPPQTPWPKVAIVVLNWNGWRDTIECLESLQNIVYPDYEVIVVDNGSTDESVERIRAWALGQIPVASPFLAYQPGAKPVEVVVLDRRGAENASIEARALDELLPSRKLILVRLGENIGFAAGNNVGIRYALKRDYPYICLLNNDTVVDPQYLSRLVGTLEANPHWMAVDPKILCYDSPSRIWYAGGQVMLWRAGAVHVGFNQVDDNRSQARTGIHKTEHCTGCCMVARSDLFKTVGLLDEDFFFGHEDVAYSCSAREYGMDLAVNLDSVIYHKASLGSDIREAPRVYYYNKYRLLNLKKHGTPLDKTLGFPFYAFTRLLKFPVLLGKGHVDTVLAELLAIRDFLLGRFGDYDRKRASKRG